MKDRKLKNYPGYLQRLKEYTRASGLKLEYNDSDGEGVYVANLKKIKLDPEMSHTREIAVFLHELGHAFDVASMTLGTKRKLERAYYNCDTDCHTKRQLELVVRCEKRAWYYGEAIAKILTIRLGKWYRTIRKECLHSYRKTVDSAK